VVSLSPMFVALGFWWFEVFFLYYRGNLASPEPLLFPFCSAGNIDSAVLSTCGRGIRPDFPGQRGRRSRLLPFRVGP